MYYDDSTRKEFLQKLYDRKIGQLEHGKLSSNTLRYQVLKAEAEAIKAELEPNEA